MRSPRASLRRTGAALALLVVLQIGLGAATVLTKKNVPITTAHVAAGALLLGGAVALSAASLAAERRRNNVIPIRSAMAGRASGWK
jgi:heme A synthase